MLRERRRTRTAPAARPSSVVITFNGEENGVNISAVGQLGGGAHWEAGPIWRADFEARKLYAVAEAFKKDIPDVAFDIQITGRQICGAACRLGEPPSENDRKWLREFLKLS